MPVCSTGNCTWPAYSSLGICTQTKEVTDLRDKVCEPCKGKNLTVAAKQCHRACDMPSTFLNVTALKSNTLQKYSTSGIPTNVSTSLAFPEIEWPIADVMMAYRNNFSFIGDESNRTFESIFYFCVQEFETKETNGRFETVMTKVGARTSNKTINDGANARVDESPQLTVRLENRDEPAFVIEPEAVFSVSTAMWQAFKGGMGFDGVVTPTSEVGRVLGTIVDQGPKQSERKPNQYDKLPGIMENIAIAMSNDLKQTPGNGTAVLRHEGTAYSLEIYIKVTWPWLSLLFVTVLLSILLLAMTMIRSMSTRTRVWKTSSLPVLQILSQGVRGDMGVPNRVGASEERAEVRVELEQRQGGYEKRREFAGDRGIRYKLKYRLWCITYRLR
ncbi:hypothetical protein K469DRAFT_278099 [Zopfia rhizophila CBS 207.26]|uniref:Uncharacterized protein n=1 Tax=Zopfia rhizophila CBS 207.26 TaxID=1314779 RepID=A0A6A6DPS7_9PEZI|nr:hypothetical protein K469DRAFT_278099 [Zopfia rhizophila CBS 207.26]